MARPARELSELQREKTAELLVYVVQGLVLATMVAVFIPSLEIKIGVGRIVVGWAVSVVLYILAMRTLQGIKR